jgi:hypothetical protein
VKGNDRQDNRSDDQANCCVSLNSEHRFDGIATIDIFLLLGRRKALTIISARNPDGAIAPQSIRNLLNGLGRS